MIRPAAGKIRSTKIFQILLRTFGRNILGENIRRLRKEKNINQKELASNLHTLRQTVSAYERGVTLPDVFMLIMIADFFGVSLDELTGRTELVIPEEEV